MHSEYFPPSNRHFAPSGMCFSPSNRHFAPSKNFSPSKRRVSLRVRSEYFFFFEIAFCHFFFFFFFVRYNSFSYYSTVHPSHAHTILCTLCCGSAAASTRVLVMGGVVSYFVTGTRSRSPARTSESPTMLDCLIERGMAQGSLLSFFLSNRV